MLPEYSKRAFGVFGVFEDVFRGPIRDWGHHLNHSFAFQVDRGILVA